MGSFPCSLGLGGSLGVTVTVETPKSENSETESLRKRRNSETRRVSENGETPKRGGSPKHGETPKRRVSETRRGSVFVTQASGLALSA